MSSIRWVVIAATVVLGLGLSTKAVLGAHGSAPLNATFQLNQFTTQVPEHASLMLLGGGLFVIAARVRRRKA